MSLTVSGTFYSWVLQDLCKDIATWRALSHPSLLELIGVSKTVFPGELCLVTKWLDNGNVITFLQDNPRADRVKFVRPATNTCDARLMCVESWFKSRQDSSICTTWASYTKI